MNKIILSALMLLTLSVTGFAQSMHERVTTTNTTVTGRQHSGFHFGNRPHNDRHFTFGFHDRDWWITRYKTIVQIDGCWYYLDDGFYYPAYGYDNCEHQDQYRVYIAR